MNFLIISTYCSSIVITEWGAQPWGTETAFFLMKCNQKMCPGITPNVLLYLMPANKLELV